MGKSFRPKKMELILWRHKKPLLVGIREVGLRVNAVEMK